MGTTATDGARSVPDVLGTLREARRRLAEMDVSSLSATQRQELLEEVQRTVGSLTTAQGRLLVAVEQNEEWRGSGDRSLAAWHGRTSGVGNRAGRAQVRQARTIEVMPQVAEAVADGVMSPAHLDTLARVTERASEAVKALLTAPAGQAELLGLARRTDAERFGRAVERTVAELDPAGLDRGFAEQRAARFLHLTDTTDGTRIKGLLDPVAGLELRKALEALSPRPGDGDVRTAEQRTADALSAMAGAVLSDPMTLSGAAVRPQVSFVMTEESWLHLKQRQAAKASGAVLELEATSAEPVSLEDGTPVASSVIARMLCDCELTRIVVDAQSQPVDVGRSKRLYDGHLRRAIMVRDRTCSWPGCDMHARWSEVHHVRWWDRDGGETSIENGLLLCSFHHHCVHEMNLSISRHPVQPGESASNGIADVRYEFRRPDGKLVAPQLRPRSPATARDGPGSTGPPGRTDAGAPASHVRRGMPRPGRRPDSACDAVVLE